jgi:MFS family permease
LVVPILSSYFRDAGGDSNQYGYITSLFSISQLISGMVLSYLSDSLSKRSILMLSFIGSGVSYFIVGVSGSISMIFLSRIIVGLVKQTYQISTLIIITATNDDLVMRTRELSQLSAISSMSFLIGPSIGGIMYRAHPMMPAVIASMLFFINIIILSTVGSLHVMDVKKEVKDDVKIASMGRSSSSSSEAVAHADKSKSDDDDHQVNLDGSGPSNSDNDSSNNNNNNNNDTDQSNHCNSNNSIRDTSYQKDSTPSSTTSPDTIVFTSMTIFIATLRLLISFVQSSLTSRYILNYYEDRFGMETYQLGFISSLMTGFSIIAESFIVGPALSIFRNNDYQSIIACLFILSILYTIESTCTSLWSFIVLALLPGSVVSTILSAAIRSLFLQLIPSSHIGKVSGLFNAASTGIGVIAPIYGSQIFSLVIGADLIKSSPDSAHDVARRYNRGIALRQKGYITAAHYLALFIICSTHYILSQGSSSSIIVASKREHVKKDSVEEKDTSASPSTTTFSSSSSSAVVVVVTRGVIIDNSANHTADGNIEDDMIHDNDINTIATSADSSSSSSSSIGIGIDAITTTSTMKRRSVHHVK